MSPYANKTRVSIAQSKNEIEALVKKYGASGYGSGWTGDEATVTFQMQSRVIRFTLHMPRREKSKTVLHWEQACRAMWRALVLVLKAKLEAVASGISVFDQEFLAQVVTGDGQTIYERLTPQLASLNSKTTHLLIGEVSQ